ncbi:hypothetical protein A2U01_0094338, partial [Trifolium medium]|nr:hypothetical protein [Trifolium medium]
ARWDLAFEMRGCVIATGRCSQISLAPDSCSVREVVLAKSLSHEDVLASAFAFSARV